MRAAKDTALEPRRAGVVTSLAAKSGGSDRVVVYLDGSRAFDLAAVVADRAGLRVGDLLAVEAQEQLLEQDAPHRARERSLRFIALRDRSCHEVEARLREAGFSGEVISETVLWLRGLGYIDDERFAARYAGEKSHSGWGERRVRSELLRKGVGRPAIEAAMAAAVEPDDADRVASLEAVIALARRRFGRQFESDPEGAARRLAGFLGRRGYDWDTIRRVAGTLSDEAAGQGAALLP
ncbi:MAG: hypothetical protein A2133_11875 [Actinobacteria bacterium RBG_16_64_13]|nr:MAG: hypothetical protein A2133_11875 [Actinobacteria bacterium RBG_16_64_13]